MMMSIQHIIIIVTTHDRRMCRWIRCWWRLSFTLNVHFKTSWCKENCWALMWCLLVLTQWCNKCTAKRRRMRLIEQFNLFYGYMLTSWVQTSLRASLTDNCDFHSDNLDRIAQLAWDCWVLRLDCCLCQFLSLLVFQLRRSLPTVPIQSYRLS